LLGVTESMQGVARCKVWPCRRVVNDWGIICWPFISTSPIQRSLPAVCCRTTKSPNRFNSLYGAGKSVELVVDAANAAAYYRQLAKIAVRSSGRMELRGKE